MAISTAAAAEAESARSQWMASVIATTTEGLAACLKLVNQRTLVSSDILLRLNCNSSNDISTLNSNMQFSVSE